MTFSIGQRVRMKRTDNNGEVTSILPGGLVQVKLDGGLGHIPIPVEALEAVPTAKEEVRTVAPPPQQRSNPAVSGGNGVQIAFDTVLNNQDEPVAYEVYLLNSTPHKIIYELKVLTHSHRRWSKAGQLEANTKKRLEAVDYQWLNEKLSCELDVRTVATGGTGPRHFQRVNIKGKQFFSKLTEVPELYREAHLYVVFPSLRLPDPAPAASPHQPSLKAITKAHVANRPKKQDPALKKVEVKTDLHAKLDFENVIDLHLPALVRNPDAVPKNQVLSTQMRYFENYLQMALKLGVDSIFIIHGVGNGVLKREIHKTLEKTRFVRKFKNEYHEKYGYGATEVIFD
ncbi:MAG: Smr/MutS family protein [Bacteroidota bacterium]